MRIIASVVTVLLLLVAVPLFIAIRLSREHMFANDVVLLLGEKGLTHGTQFTYMRLGSVGTPYHQAWDIRLKFPDGREVSLNDASYVRYLLESGEQRSDANANAKVWPKGSVRVVDSRCCFIIFNERVLQMTYLMDVSDAVSPIEIRSNKCQEWTQFPLSASGARDLFGVPVKEDSYYRW